MSTQDKASGLKTQTNNRGSLFVNDKGGNESRPDYKGIATINGVNYDVAGWKQTAKSGVKYLSLKFSEDLPKPTATPKPAASAENDPF